MVPALNDARWANSGFSSTLRPCKLTEDTTRVPNLGCWQHFDLQDWWSTCCSYIETWGPLKKTGKRLTPQLTCKEFGKFHPRILLVESSPPESIGNHTMWSQFHPPCFALLRRKNHWSNHGELLPPKQKFQMNLPTRVIGHSTDFFELERIERGNLRVSSGRLKTDGILWPKGWTFMVHVVFFSCKSGWIIWFHPPQLHHLIFWGGKKKTAKKLKSPQV